MAAASRWFLLRPVGADRIRPQHKAPLRGTCVPGRHIRRPLQWAGTLIRVLANIRGYGRLLAAPTGRVRSTGCFLKFVVAGGFYPPLRFEQGTRHHSPNCSIPQVGGATYSSTYRACANIPSARLYFAPYFTTRRGVIQASECKQNAARPDFRRAAWVYFTFLAFAATAFASAIISRC